MTLDVFLLIGLSAFIQGTWNFIAKRSAGNRLILILVGWFVFGIFFLPISILFADLSAMDMTWLWLVVASSLVHVVYIALLSWGYASGEISVVYPVSRGLGIAGTTMISSALAAIATALGVFFLKEKLYCRKVIAIACIVIGMFVIKTAPARGETVFEGRFRGSDWLRDFIPFRLPPWTEGLDRATTVMEGTSAVLQVRYPANKFGNDKTGVQWKTYLDRSYDRLTLTYRVKFAGGFDFVKGGKLPGLVGGHKTGSPDSVVSGGYKPSGNDGWSGRVMWRRDGRVVQYLYHPDQPTNYGEDLPWRIDGAAAKFLPGTWHELKTEIVMNEPGLGNGELRGWLDGKLALDRRNLQFRKTANIAIDALYFSTFFGGDDQSWASSKDEIVFFDSFKIEE